MSIKRPVLQAGMSYRQLQELEKAFLDNHPHLREAAKGAMLGATLLAVHTADQSRDNLHEAEQKDRMTQVSVDEPSQFAEAHHEPKLVQFEGAQQPARTPNGLIEYPKQNSGAIDGVEDPVAERMRGDLQAKRLKEKAPKSGRTNKLSESLKKETTKKTFTLSEKTKAKLSSKGRKP